MKVTVLGCGTSTGVPVISCPCEVCTSKDPRNRRTRASIMITNGNANVIIDTSPDLRCQALENKINRVDAVLYTHAHADHIFGLDDLRIYNFLQTEKIPIYGSGETMSHIRKVFSYIWNPDAPLGGGKPMLETNVMEKRAHKIAGVNVEPVKIMHGSVPIYGYVFDSLAYLTDCSAIPDETRELVKGKEVLILGALRYRPHPTHFCLDEALAAIEDIKPGRAFLTHMSHSFDYEKTNAELPKGVELAYDGMVIDLDEKNADAE